MKNKFQPTDYQLENLATGRKFQDTGWTLDDPEYKLPALVRAIYSTKQINFKPNDWGLYKYHDWLPIHRALAGSSAPVTYQSSGLAKLLGTKNLFITFSGYWPEKGAFNRTCSFKETESYSVAARLPESEERVLVVASAGNTARAFARVCSDNSIPLLLCLPEDNLDAMWFDEPIADCVKLVTSAAGSDYFDAIHLSNIAASLDFFIAEGGAKNVARRDGMGTTTLSAAHFIGKIPDYYFQAVGSGTGAIAAYEANLRLLQDGRFGTTKMKLMVSQNEPFKPIFDAWQLKSRDLLPFEDDQARLQVQEILAKVLSNRKPPYSIKGGLFDALTANGGEVLLANNKEAHEAAKIFFDLEGNDIHPASAIATATLIKAAKSNLIDKSATIMLNITGGGEERIKSEKKLFFLKPNLNFQINPDPVEVETQLRKLFNR